ncbi:hypothetical protein [Lysinibacillus xylanilyticus]|uniref:Uncharacterized protein n=1 Tax=Lysinibacillus xylanilyticus TaxID=582475 RepID=A0ABT4EMB0_9BACI|nr:hypothetical protein [Lysinibacillus xylanilyticus]MCY9546785.1 hypothetical protein [Lysinibacillus xylanilyticus]
MARYESRYKSLGFYVNDELKRFNNGTYVTDDKDDIAVLDAIADAICVDEPKPEAKPAAKTSARRASAK